MLSSKTPTESTFGGSSIKFSLKKTLLGVFIGSELDFEEHIFLICTKASSKLNALVLIANFMAYEKRRVIIKAFVESQFNYYPLIWGCFIPGP